jgi:hypothetical protein
MGRAAALRRAGVGFSVLAAGRDDGALGVVCE